MAYGNRIEGRKKIATKIGDCWWCGFPVHLGYAVFLYDAHTKTFHGLPQRRLLHKGYCADNATERLSYGNGKKDSRP